MSDRTELLIWTVAVVICLIGIVVMMPPDTWCTWEGR